MKITCALNQDQAANLYKTVYASLSEALKSGEPFDYKEYMSNLFDKIADRKDEDTAIKFLQQVPSIIRVIASSPSFDKLDVKLDPIKDLSVNFKNEDDGFSKVLDYFKPQVSERAKRAIIKAKENEALILPETDPSTVVTDPVRLRPFSAAVSTMQQLVPINPLQKTNQLEESVDPARQRIYTALERIRTEMQVSENTDLSLTISYQGRTLKLKPILLSELYKIHPDQIDNTTKRNLIIRPAVLKGKELNKEEVSAGETIALVLTDGEGKYLYFNENGDITSQEEGGGVVYQFMRDVRTGNGRYRITNAYGYEQNIQTPEDIAEGLGITIEAATKLQQDELKALYNLKQSVLRGEDNSLNVSDVSPGVRESIAQKKITLQNLRQLPFVNNATFRDIVPVMTGGEVSAKITINGKEYDLDRPNITKDLINKISLVMSNPTISNKAKYDFIQQFLADKASMATRRHTISFDVVTNDLVFTYTEKTKEEGTGQTKTLVNEELNGQYNLFSDVLTNASKDKYGNFYTAKMTYNAAALEGNRYNDYNTETNTINEEFSPYLPLLETLPGSRIIMNQQTDPGVFNSHMRFSIPDQFTKDIEEALKNPDPIDVSETPVEPTETVEAPVAEAPTQEESIKNSITPDNTDTPSSGGVASLFDLDRKGVDLNGVTEQQIKDAKEWWSNSPLAKFMDFETMVNLVNSDVYAKFIAYGSVLNGKLGKIQIGERGSMVDVYHEAWHAFSQLFLTPEQRTKLYNEVAKQPGSFTLLDGTTVAFKDANYLQLEEYLAEDFRDYSIDQSVKKGQPARNTLFRKILSFIKNLFTKNTKDRLFKELYFAKSNPKFLNKYSPSISNVSFQKLNRGLVSLTDPTLDVLNRQDVRTVSNSMDSIMSDVVDTIAKETNLKNGTLKVFLGDKNRQALYNIINKQFTEKLNEAKANYELVKNDPTKVLEASKQLDKIRIFQAALDNFGDAKSGLVKYHLENSAFNLINKKYKTAEEELEEEGAKTDGTSTDIKDTVSDKKVGDKSLLDLASKETLYLLKSLHKIENGKPVYNELGFKELASFTDTWNNVMRAVNGEKDPQKIYNNIKEAGEEVYPAFKQLIQSKLPDPSQSNNFYEVKLGTNFWQDVQKTRATYLQTTIFENGIAEVTKASIETASLANKFQAKFKGDLANKFVDRTTDTNVPMLNLKKVVDEFGTNGILDAEKSYSFARAIGLYFDDLRSIKNELNKDQKTREAYGLPFIYKTLVALNAANEKQGLSPDARKAITEFRLNPIQSLMKGIPAGVIGPKEVSQKNKIEKLLGLQAKYGADSSNFAVLNAERNLVFEHIDDHTVSMMVYALNKAADMKDFWTKGSEFEFLSFLNPKINSFTTRLQVIQNLFDVNDGFVKRTGKSLQMFIDSGTQVENGEGTNTTSLDVHGKFLQELHSMLKGGMQEFMRHASKSSSFGARLEGGILGGKEKGSDTRLWVDIDKFAVGTADNYVSKTHMIPYIAAELERINKFKANKNLFKNYKGYNRPMADGTMAGENFTAFDNVLTEDTKKEILEKVTDPNVRFEDYLKTDPDLARKIELEVGSYFNQQTADLIDFYEEAEYMSPDLLDRLKKFNLEESDAVKVLVKAYAVNAWVQNFEMGSLFYGDIVQYNHEKEELHKRNSGSTSGGLKVRTDKNIQRFITELNATTSYAATIPGMDTLKYTGKYNTAILQDIERDSVYVERIEKALRKDYTERFANTSMTPEERKAEIDRRVDLEIAKYKGMEEGDGQGWITIDAYRALKIASGEWSDLQEDLFKKIIKNEPVKASDVVELFPVYKAQHYGHLADTDLPVIAMHKFALAPMIPSMIKGSDLEKLHVQMMKNNIQYVTFQTGSKVGSVTSDGKADKIYADSEQKSILPDIKFTPNTIYLEYLKDVTKVPTAYKGKTVFSTQLRKLILSNLYSRGIVDSKQTALVKNYEDTVDEYGNLLKMELLNDIGYELKDGKYIGNFQEFVKVIQRELTRKDLPEHHVEFVNLNPDNSLKTDLSLHLKSDDIEKILVALMEKRLIKQKIKGEALVQVSSAMTNGLWDTGLKKGTDEDIRKYMGSNNLPFYDQTENGTSAMKVAIALQGDFVNLLKLKDNDGVVIGTRERLNEMIKDDKWMEQHGKTVTLTAVRIPVQGLNSMEYMQVYEFLDPAAGNIIIPPSEIVAKSGADYDVDKLTTFMPAINSDGQFIESGLDNEAIQRLIDQNKNTPEGKALINRTIKQQKAALENKLITSISDILKLPENYASLVRPNDTYLLKDDIADKLEDKVSDYNRFNNYHGEAQRKGKKTERSISPTRTLEPLYNLHKHESNMIGKAVLGLVAIHNALHPIFNSLGATMPKSYKNSEYDFNEQKYVEGTKDLAMRMFMPHNKTDDGRISLSDMYSADNKDLISDLFSQLINGTADVEKDAWIFFIQGNMEIAPMLLMMFKAGVPKDYAVKFVSQPLIREYAKEQRLLGSSYADLTADELTKIKGSKQQKAAFNVLSKFGVDSPESYIKGNNYHTAVTKLTKKSGILNEDGEFDSRLLDKILNEPENPALRAHQLAIFMHFIELEKQFSGFQDLMRLANPDTTTSKTTQEMLLRKVLLDELEGSSKIEEGLVNKLRKESILNTFYDNDIITQLIEPLFPLKNNKYISNSIIDYLTKSRSNITKAFGKGDDGRRFFITNFKNGVVNSIFQNAMFNYNEATQAALNIPSELISKYFTGDVFFQNSDYSFADDLLQIIEENPGLKEKYSIVNQISKPELKDGQQVITLNDNKLLKDGQLAEAYYENLKNLADPNVEKVEDTEKNLYISNMFKILPLMAIYQNGVGYSKYGFNEALPFDDFLAVTKPASDDFLNNSLNQGAMNNIFDKLIDPKNKFFRNYINITPAQATVKSTQPSTSVNKGVEISSNAKGLAAALTNPTELAKSKGNLTQSYPIEFRGKTYKDAEAAYQALKSTATKDDGPNSTYNLMVNIIKAKLEQYPRLVSEITKQGGSAWILFSTHQPTKQNSVWETGGQNWFIQSLNDAYIATTQPTVVPTVTDSIKESELPKATTDQVFTFSGKSLQEQFDILASPEFTSWYATELSKNPNLDAAEALDYYIKCKGL